MGKQQTEHIETFTIIARGVAKGMVGDVLGDLAKRDITNVSYELVTDVIGFKNNIKHDVSAEEHLIGWIQDNPTFRARDAGQFFEQTGRSKTSVYAPLSALVESGTLKRLDDKGNYARADVKHIEAPKKDKKQKKIERQHFDVDHREFILRYARQHGGRINRQKLIAYFEAHDRKGSSVGGALNMLIQRKKLKALGDGEYVIPKPKPKKEEPKPNGNGNHIETPEAVTNG